MCVCYIVELTAFDLENSLSTRTSDCLSLYMVYTRNTHDGLGPSWSDLFLVLSNLYRQKLKLDIIFVRRSLPPLTSKERCKLPDWVWGSLNIGGVQLGLCHWLKGKSSSCHNIGFGTLCVWRMHLELGSNLLANCTGAYLEGGRTPLSFPPP